MIFKNKQELLRAFVHPTDTVLDVGFLGQGIKENSPKWPHAIIKSITNDVYGIDLELSAQYKNNTHYQEVPAEHFSFPVQFDLIFAGDLIEHLSNPGLFLDCVRVHLKPDGILLLTTPNTFNLFNMTEKLTKKEPTTNPDHTFYFNSKVLKKLLEKNGMVAERIDWVYSLEYDNTESFKKKFLNVLYWFLSKSTDKFIETLVVTATALQP